MKKIIRKSLKGSLRRYGKIKNTLWASARAGFVTSMMLVGTSTAFAQPYTLYRGGMTSSPQSVFDQADQADYIPFVSSTDAKVDSKMHTMHRFNSRSRARGLAKGLGVSESDMSRALSAGKPVKQMLIEKGIMPSELK